MADKRTRSNLDDIAVKCGVSKMTVSRALRQDSGVSDNTREMIMRVAAEEGYFPLGARKSDSAPSSNRYYIVFQQIYTEKGSFFNDLIISIQRELFSENLACSFGVIKDDYAEFLKLYNVMKADNTYGILVVGDAPIEYLNILLENFSRVVFVDYPGDGRLTKPHDAVVFNNHLGCYKAVGHLVGLGRRRILLLTGAESHYFSKVMLSAYKDALSDNNIEYDPSLVIPSGFHLNDGYETVRQLAERGLHFDAIFSTDMVACGAMNALRSSGVRIPEDVSVVGFDGLPVGEAVSPALTTVALDREKMGKMAVRRIRKSEEDSCDDFLTLSLLPKLVIRQSCGAGLKEDRVSDGCS